MKEAMKVEEVAGAAPGLSAGKLWLVAALKVVRNALQRM